MVWANEVLVIYPAHTLLAVAEALISVTGLVPEKVVEVPLVIPAAVPITGVTVPPDGLTVRRPSLIVPLYLYYFPPPADQTPVPGVATFSVNVQPLSAAPGFSA